MIRGPWEGRAVCSIQATTMIDLRTKARAYDHDDKVTAFTLARLRTPDFKRQGFRLDRRMRSVVAAPVRREEHSAAQEHVDRFVDLACGKDVVARLVAAKWHHGGTPGSPCKPLRCIEGRSRILRGWPRYASVRLWSRVWVRVCVSVCVCVQACACMIMCSVRVCSRGYHSTAVSADVRWRCKMCEYGACCRASVQYIVS